MVMFKAKFRPMAAGQPAPRRNVQQQQQPQPQPTVPPIEEERGPQYPVKEPEPLNAPERAEEAVS